MAVAAGCAARAVLRRRRPLAARAGRRAAREWFCVGRLRRSGWTSGRAERLAVVDVAGESVLVTRGRATGELHAFFNVCRHRGSQVVPGRPGRATRRRRAGAAALRCPYHSWTYDLDGRLLRAPHTEDVDDFDPTAFGLHPVGVDAWGGFLFAAPGAGRRGRRCVDELGRGAGPGRALPARPARRRPPADLRRAARTTRSCWRTTTSATTAAGVHPELVRLVPAFGARRRRPRLGGRHPAPRRARGRSPRRAPPTARRSPGLDEDERVRHKGELRLPQPDAVSLSADHVAAFTLWPTRPWTAPGSSATCCSRPTRSRGTPSTPSDAADLWDLVNRQDWAICESVQRGMSSRAYTQGWFAPMEDASLDIRRWLLPRLGRGRAGVTPASDVDVRRRRARRARQRDGLAAGPARASRRRARAVRARPRARRLARHLADPAAQLPHAGLRPPDRRGVRRLGRSRGASPASGSSRSPAGSTSSRRARRSRPIDYTTSACDACGVPYEVLDAAEVTRALAAAARCPTGTVALYQERHGDRAGRRAAPRRCSGWPAAPGATLRERLAGDRRCATSATTASRSTTAAGDVPRCGRRRGHRGRLDQRPARPPRHRRCR